MTAFIILVSAWILFPPPFLSNNISRLVGDMEPDYESDFWADHDENCHGIIDSKESREEYPEGFLWDCCGRIGTDPGCVSFRHEAHPDKRRGSCDTLESSKSDLGEGDGERGGEKSKDGD